MKQWLGLLCLAAATSIPCNAQRIGQAVNTTSGLVFGHASKTASQVSEYLGIRFAESTAGRNRFMAPVRYNSNTDINAKAFDIFSLVHRHMTRLIHRPRGCPAKSEDVLFKLIDLATSITSGAPDPSEDCLFINVWTKPQVGEKAKPVMVYIYGGGFASGDTTLYDGSRLADSEDVIIVSFGYRTNIFGFPGAKGLPNQNLGMLDQRMAVEWVRDNIGSFGGDSKRITLFGQSAGAVSADFYTYIWKDDPIITGLISNSGNAHQSGPFRPPPASARYAAWDDVSQKLGCGREDGDGKTWKCLQTKTVAQIQAVMPQLDGAKYIVGAFGPTIDEKYVFSDYDERAMRGDFIPVPMLVGSNQNESLAFSVLTLNTATAQELRGITYDYQCGAAKAALARAARGIPAWRYYYSGTSASPVMSSFGLGEWGATHGADLVPLFGIGGTENGQLNVFQDAWTAFAHDPKHGLSRMTWPQYRADGETLVRLGFKDAKDPDFVKSTMYDDICQRKPHSRLAPYGGMHQISGSGWY